MSAFPHLEGKVAVITGGASGIGRGIAEQLVAAGMKVVIGDIEAESLQSTADALGALGVRTDVTDSSSVEALAQAALAAHGAVHVVCNNAGIGPMAPVADMTLSDWRWIIDVNLMGVIYGVQSFLPILKANPDGGHIVNTSSIAGLVAGPGIGGYAVTKYAVTALSEALALELAAENSKVGVSILCPGPVRSNIGKSERNRPGDLEPGKLQDVDLENAPGFEEMIIPWINASEAGAIVLDAIKSGDLYVFTHPQMAERITSRHAAIADALTRAAGKALPANA